jgi:hypothetical protein
MDVVFRDGKKPGVPREKHSTGIFYNVSALTPPPNYFSIFAALNEIGIIVKSIRMYVLYAPFLQNPNLENLEHGIDIALNVKPPPFRPTLPLPSNTI